MRWKATTTDPAHRAVARWRSRGLFVVAPAAAVALALILSGGSAPAVAPGESESAPTQGAGLRTIVIDPGHGGQSTGALGAGVSEKDVTLDIAVRLREIIYRRLGLQVMLTRESDVYLDLDTRTEKANNWQADLFVSIHANGYRMDDVRGPETYFLSAKASDTMARNAAARENAADAQSGSGPDALDPADDPTLEFILWDLAQTHHLRESSMLAESVQASLNGLWELRDRGVKQAPFRVLKGATMPAVLVEVGYLSNPDDARRLADPGFRQRVAESIFGGLSSFRRQFAVLDGGPNP